MSAVQNRARFFRAVGDQSDPDYDPSGDDTPMMGLGRSIDAAFDEFVAAGEPTPDGWGPEQ